MFDDDNNGGDEVDESLFPNPEDEQEAEQLWGAGNEANDAAKPKGSFQAEILDSSLGRSTGTNRLQIHYHLKLLSGKPAEIGTELHKYDGMGSEKQVEITQQQLRRLGIDTKKVNIKSLPAHLLNLKGKKVVINCKQNGDFHNITFQKLMTDTPAGGPRPGGSAPKPGGSPKPGGATKPGTGRAGAPPQKKTF
jgi:hypothetical protein